MMNDAAALAAERPGALRILARRDDNEVLIVEGEDRRPDVAAGERLAWVEWLGSQAEALAVARFCLWRLSGPFPPNANGWHSFPVAHLPVLVANALAEKGITFGVPDPEPRQAERQPERQADRQAWSGPRIARLGFLVGQGNTAKKIADDPLIASTPGNVYRQAHKFELAFVNARQGQVALRLPVGTMAVYDRAAEQSGLSTAAYLRRLLIAHAADPVEVLPIE